MKQRAGGKKNYARYPFYEANIAAIMLQLRELGCGTEVMKGIVAIYREAIAWGQSRGFSPKDIVALGLYMQQLRSIW